MTELVREVIRQRKKHRFDKDIHFYETPYPKDKDGVVYWQCMYNSFPWGAEVDDFTKEEMIDLQNRGYIFYDEHDKKRDVTKL